MLPLRTLVLKLKITAFTATGAGVVPLLAASISHFVTPAVKLSFFFLERNSSPLFSITRCCSFSVINVSVNIKNNVEKDMTSVVFVVFLFSLQSDRPCDFLPNKTLSCIWVAIPD